MPPIPNNPQQTMDRLTARLDQANALNLNNNPQLAAVREILNDMFDMICLLHLGSDANSVLKNRL